MLVKGIDAPGRELMRFVCYRLPVLVYMGVIFFVSSGPISSPSIQEIPDYLLHGAAFALLSILSFWAVHEDLKPGIGRGGYWLPALIAVAYGAIDEWHQSFVPGRDASVHDWLADVAGVILGILLIPGISRLISRFLERRIT